MKCLLPEPIRLRRWKVGFTTPEMRWLKAQRPAVEEILRSKSFRSRPFWDADGVADAFAAVCEDRLAESLIFWRAINVEIWMRVFFDAPIRQPTQARSAQEAMPAALPRSSAGSPASAPEPAGRRG